MTVCPISFKGINLLPPVLRVNCGLNSWPLSPKENSVKLTHPLLLNANPQDKPYKIRDRDSMYEQHDRIQP